MKFENLIDQALRLARSKSAILKIRQTEYKTKRSTTFVKKMKSTLEKSVRDRSSNLLRVIKQRRKLSSEIDTRLNDLTEIMKKMIVNVDNLMNCVSFFDERENSELEQYSFQISPRYSFQDSSLFDSAALFSPRYSSQESMPLSQSSQDSSLFDSAAFFSSRYSSQESMSLSQSSQVSSLMSSSMFSSMSSINEALRFSQNKCIYCYSQDHLYKRNCQAFNENLRIERIHLQNRKIHLDLYNFEVSHVRMTFYKSQRQCVKEAKKLAYSSRVAVVFAKIHIVRLKKDVVFELFTNEEEEDVVLIDHESHVSVEIILTVVHFESKVFNSSKKQELIKKILKKRIEKEEKFFTLKVLRFEK
jgi:hypothetical protein